MTIEWPVIPIPSEDPVFWNLLRRDRLSTFGGGEQHLSEDCEIRIFIHAGVSFNTTTDIPALIISTQVEVEFNFWKTADSSIIAVNPSSICLDPFLEDTNPLAIDDADYFIGLLERPYTTARVEVERLIDAIKMMPAIKS